MVTFVTEGPPCACGLRPRGIEVATVRVNRRSLKTQGFSLGGMPWHCQECRLPLGHESRLRRWLVGDDAAKVAAYRERRWPARPSNGPQSVQGSPSTGQAGFVALAGTPPTARGHSVPAVDP